VGQVWRDKRRPERVIRVTNLFVGKAPGGGKPSIRVEYEFTSRQARKNARPVAESCFRGDYELVTPSPAKPRSKRGQRKRTWGHG